MSQTLQIVIKSAIFDRERLLTINPGYIEFDNNELKSASPVKFLKRDIVSFRHGVTGISGFITGNIYCIDIRNSEEDIIEIRLKSIYGLRENEMAEKYLNILTGLCDNYFNEISRRYLKQFESGVEFNILDIQFNKKGIFLHGKPKLLPWKDIEVKVYYAYYSICSISAAKSHCVIESLTSWNAGVLYSVLIQILKYNKLLSLKRTGPPVP